MFFFNLNKRQSKIAIIWIEKFLRNSYLKTKNEIVKKSNKKMDEESQMDVSTAAGSRSRSHAGIDSFTIGVAHE